MRKQNTFLLAMAGAALMAAQARGQTYSATDLLLNFRNPNLITANNLEVNLGPVADLTSGVVAPASLVTGVFGTIGTGSGDVSVGFSASAAVASQTTGEIWLTRVDTAADAAANKAPTDLYTSPAQSVFSTQNPIAIKIGDIGAGYNSGTAISGVNNAVTVPGGAANSYQLQGEQNSGTGSSLINYGTESTAASKGGTIESIQNGSGNVYEALWDIPASGTGNAPVYDGYFTFQPSGEVDFTSVTATPEPSSYVLLISTGLGAWAMRRKNRA